MSSMVCQGDQSFVEPLAFGTCSSNQNFIQPKTLQWPQIPLISKHQNEQQENLCYQISHDNENNSLSKYPQDNRAIIVEGGFDKNNNNGDTSGWSLIQSLSNKNAEVKNDENVYVHPLVKKPSILSLESLEMCTESLGSETGSDTSETGDDFSFPLSPKTNEEDRQIWQLKYEKITKKVSEKPNFPPPLTSITGSENIQVTPHREGGRLVLKATMVFPSNSYFMTERIDGRLRLCLVEDYSPTSDDFENDGEYEQQEEEDYDDDDIWDEEIGGNSENVEGEMETGERPMPRRCKEGGHENKEMPHWEPFWVAIS